MVESLLLWAPLGLLVLLYLAVGYLMTRKHVNLAKKSIEVTRENTEAIRELIRELGKLQKCKY
ncbi:hypothetical protein D3C76_1692100 [compost metagenome]